ncbi:MAG: sigma-70 family RNA polymerase sigma factor [Planctomycetaceae bacterium]
MTATRIARPSLRRFSPAQTLRAHGQLSSSSTRSQRRPVARRPAWLKLPELEAANLAVESACPSLADLSAAELLARTKAVLKQEIGFISNSQFSDPEFAKQIFDLPLGLAPRQSAVAVAMVRKAGIDLPVHLSRMCEAKLLTADQERMLFQRMNFLRCQAAVQRALLDVAKPSAARLELIQRLLALADWHRDRIVEANTRLVFSIVKKFVNTNNSFDDLLSDGVMALIRAVEKYDYNRGFRFSTYATQVVRRNAYRQIVQKQQERNKVASGLSELDVEPSDEDRGSAISESRWHELRSRLALMLSDLDRREKFIIRARFSLGSHRRVHTLQALADRLGVSKERVRQLERRAMEKLRAMAGEVKLVELEV